MTVVLGVCNERHQGTEIAADAELAVPKRPVPLGLSAALETDRSVVAINDDWVADRNNLRRRGLPDTERLVS
jgi:hypothetical protein